MWMGEVGSSCYVVKVDRTHTARLGHTGLVTGATAAVDGDFIINIRQ